MSAATSVAAVPCVAVLHKWTAPESRPVRPCACTAFARMHAGSSALGTPAQPRSAPPLPDCLAADDDARTTVLYCTCKITGGRRAACPSLSPQDIRAIAWAAKCEVGELQLHQLQTFRGSNSARTLIWLNALLLSRKCKFYCRKAGAV
eukprot:IDg5318t1